MLRTAAFSFTELYNVFTVFVSNNLLRESELAKSLLYARCKTDQHMSERSAQLVETIDHILSDTR